MLIVALLSIGFYLFASVLVLQQFFSSQPHTPNRVLTAAWLAIILHMATLGMAIIQAQSVQNLSVLNVASLVALLINIGLTSISQRQNSWILLPFAYAFAMVLLFSNSFTPSHYLTSLGDRPGLVAHIALALLSYAMKTLPLGTAYTVWTGIGAIGSFAVGIFFLGEPASAMRMLAAVLIISGLVLMKLSSS